MSSQNIQDVVLTPVGDNSSGQWQVSHAGHNGSSPSTYPRVMLGKGDGAYLVHFKIVGKGTGPKDVTFAGQNPISVKANSKPSPGDSDLQINAVVTSTDKKEMWVLDQNSQQVQLNYLLTVDGHGPVDPIIDNGGSNLWGGLTTSTLILGTAAIAGLAFLIGMFVYRQFFMKMRR